MDCKSLTQDNLLDIHYLSTECWKQFSNTIFVSQSNSNIPWEKLHANGMCCGFPPFFHANQTKNREKNDQRKKISGEFGLNQHNISARNKKKNKKEIVAVAM